MNVLTDRRICRKTILAEEIVEMRTALTNRDLRAFETAADAAGLSAGIQDKIVYLWTDATPGFSVSEWARIRNVSSKSLRCYDSRVSYQVPAILRP